MKKIINGKKYDTATAKEIVSYSNGLSPRDFGFWCEVLYQKRTGEFFLNGYGGPASKYSDYCGNWYTSGEKIIPFSVAEARIWMERHASVEEYESVFGEVEE